MATHSMRKANHIDSEFEWDENRKRSVNEEEFFGSYRIPIS